MPRCIEQNVDWVSACLAHLSEAGATRIEASESAAAAWTQHVHESASRLLLSRVDSWFTGVNRNLPGKKRVPLIYAGGLPLYRERSNEIAAGGYAGFVIAGAPRQG
jgi:hypothetical protein